MSELNFLSAAEMAEQIRERKISPVELTKAHLSRIAKLNPVLNAFVQTDDERALRDAQSREEQATRGEIHGPLHGVPVSIKSSLDVEGLRCETGTRLREGHVASSDAVLVDRLRRAGAIVLGVTNTPELLMAWETDNLLYGKTNNPWDLSRTAGGSSGGEAAAIASGCSAGGVGSDGGGSIRVPAHFTGICGLKPTPGRVPSTGHFPVSGGPFALIGVVGPMARTVGDLQILFEVMAGADFGDPMSAPVPIRKVSRKELKKTRIGYFEDDGRTPVTSETTAAVRRAADALRRAGFEVEPFRPSNLEEIRQLWWNLFGTAGGMILNSVIKGHEAEISPTLKEFLEWVAAEPQHTGHTLLDTWLRRDDLRGQFLREMDKFSVLLCPVAAIPAFKHGERSWLVDGKTVKYLDAWSYTEWFNLLGNPGAAVPVSRSPEGLPIGVQIVGRPWEEELVLAVAAEVERECGGYRRPKELVIAESR
jgi:Asp-tRNA(Asn)/Glu-tRNA(Gln) amidotransferase A subunit family amidase